MRSCFSAWAISMRPSVKTPSLHPRILGITLTKRNNGAAASSELAGFPYHALDTYLHKLVKAGHRVAVCDQLEDPKSVKGIVKRGVTEMVTPGIATNEKLLDGSNNNFLAGIYFPESWPDDPAATLGISFLDISTGEFFLAEGNTEYIDKLLQTLRPAEVIFQRSFQRAFKEIFGSKFYTYTLESWLFEETFATETLLKHFQTHSLKGFGVARNARCHHRSRHRPPLSERYRTSGSPPYLVHPAHRPR